MLGCSASRAEALAPAGLSKRPSGRSERAQGWLKIISAKANN